MRRAWVLCVAVALAGWPQTSSAETIWQRTRQGDRTAERRMRVSVEKVLLGVGDERDLLQARVGLITLSRDEIRDPRTIVLLLRMRREMGLSTSRLNKTLLAQALRGKLSLTERAWAQLELAHACLARAQLQCAEEALDHSLTVAWRTQVRAESLILRGIVLLRSGNAERALRDFSEVTELEAPRRLIVQAYIGQALAFALWGDEQQAAVFARRAFVTEATRATVSRLDPFWDLSLSPIESENARALLLFGKAEVARGQEPDEARTALSRACALLETVASAAPAAGEPKNGSAPAQRAWGWEVRRSLLRFYEPTCADPARLQNEDGGDEPSGESATGNDEDHL